MFEGIGAELIWDGTHEIRIPERMGAPREGQMDGTPAEQLTELSGRACYNSLGSKRSRPSDEYIKHILEVGHNSIAEHYNATLQLESSEPSFIDMISFVMLNRPWVWVTPVSPTSVRLTMNIRVVMEFDKWTRILADMISEYPVHDATHLSSIIKNCWHDLAPRLITMPHPAGVGIAAEQLGISSAEIVEPENDAEKWITIYTYGSRGFCYDSETEVLTEDGWVPWPKVNGTERFATLNMATEALEYQAATAVVHEPYHGEMVHVKSQCVDLMVTPNHRLVIRKHDTQAAKRHEEPLGIMRADTLQGRRVKFKRTAKWTGVMPEVYTIPDVVTKAPVSNQTGTCGTRTVVCAGRVVKALPFARMIGWWLAEGHLDHTPGSGYMTVITQSDGSPHWPDIISCVEGAGFTYSINKSATCPQLRVNGGRALFDYLKPFRGVANKAIPPDLKQWGPRYQAELLHGYLNGDGSRSSPGHAGEGCTVSKQLADDLQVAALKAGWSASIRVSDRTGQCGGIVNGRPIIHRKPVYVVGFGRKRGLEPLINHGGKRHESRAPYSGMVHCVTVPNGTLYVRRNGKPCWSGNSHEAVRHGDFTAFSQRSTRYCNEGKSPWTLHPLMQRYMREADDVDGMIAREETHHFIGLAKDLYKTWVKRRIPFVQARINPDDPYAKTTARKQSRGAARGLLGNALETELVFSASIMQWKHMVKMRAANAADGEIRYCFQKIVEALKSSRYADSFVDIRLTPASDGIGSSLDDGGAA